MLLGAGGCLLFLAYGAVSVWALFDLVHHYWGFNLFASLAVVVLVAMFVPGLAGIGTVLGAWLAWKWPLVGAMAFGMPALVVGVAILLGGGFVAVLTGVRDRVFGKRA
jgi:hypothetical protein